MIFLIGIWNIQLNQLSKAFTLPWYGKFYSESNKDIKKLPNFFILRNELQFNNVKSFWWLFADFVKTCTVPGFLKLALTHSFPRHPFSNPWKHQKTVSLQGVEKGCIVNEWVNYLLYDDTAVPQEMLFRNKCQVNCLRFFV